MSRVKFPILISALILAASTGAVLAQSVEIGPPAKIEEPRLKFGPPPPGWPQKFVNPTSAPANYKPPKIVSLYVNDFSLDRAAAKPGDKISGQFTLINGSPFDIYDARFAVFLAQKEKLADSPYARSPFGNPAIKNLAGYNVLDLRVSNLPVSGRLTQTFSYTLPRTLASGDYLVWLAAGLERGRSFESQPLPLKIKGSPLAFSSSFEFSDIAFVDAGSGKVSYPLAGIIPAYKPNQTVKWLYEIKNKSAKSLQLRPHIVIKKHSLFGPLIKEINGDQFTLEKGEHSVAISAPAPGPGKYIGLISFEAVLANPQNSPAGQNISVSLPSISYFPLIVEGEQAEIQNIVLEHQSPNQTALSVAVEGPFSSSPGESQANLKISVTNLETSQKTVEVVKPAALTDSKGFGLTSEVDFDLAGALPAYPSYKAAVMKGDVVLDEYSIAPNGSPPVSPAPAAKPTQSAVLLVLGLIAVLLLAGWYYLKRKPKGLYLIIFLAIVLGIFGFSHEAKAYILDYSTLPSWMTFYWYSPSRGVYSPGQGINFSSAYYTNQGFCDGIISNTHTSYSGQVVAVVSDGPPKHASQLDAYNENTIDEQFKGTNYQYLGVIASGQIGYSALCNNRHTYQSLSYQKTINGPTKSKLMNKPVYAYVIEGDQSYNNVTHEQIFITPLNYSLNVDPASITVGVGQTASYKVGVIPGFATSTFLPQPAAVDYPYPYSLPNYVFWSSPVTATYKPGDAISFGLGRVSPKVLGPHPSNCSTAWGYGDSATLAVLSDGKPKDPKTLTFQNVRDEFASTSYKTLGTLPSTLTVGYNGDCTVWFNIEISGTATVPGNAAVCSADGKLVSFDKKWANVYVIQEGAVGSFVAHQQIFIDSNATSTVIPPQFVFFKEPVNLSLGDLVNVISGEVLPPEAYTLQFLPTNTATSTGDPPTYSPIALNIKPQTYEQNELVCPDSCGPGASIINNDPDYCVNNNGDVCGQPSWQPVTITPLGTYRFAVNGLSGGDLPGIKPGSNSSNQPLLTVTANPPPDGFDNLRLNGTSTCASVPLAWDPTADFHDSSSTSGYRVQRVELLHPTTTLQLLATTTPDQTTFTDNTVVSSTAYVYWIEAFNQYGSTNSNKLPVNVPACLPPGTPLPNLPDLVVVKINNPGSPLKGDTITLRGTIQNKGGANATSSFDNAFEISVSSTVPKNPPDVTSSVSILSLAVNATTSLSMVWQNIPAGTHTLRLCAAKPPPSFPVVDQSDHHNCKNLTFTVQTPAPQLLADPVAKSIADPSPVHASTTIVLTGTIKNQGKADMRVPITNLFEIHQGETYVDSPNNIVLNSDQLTPSLQIGEVAETSSTWSNIPSAGPYAIRLCANTPSSTGQQVVDQTDGHNCTAEPGTPTSTKSGNDLKINVQKPPPSPPPLPPPLTVSCSPYPTTVVSGNPVTWLSYVANGTTPYSYVWSGDVSGNNSTVTITYTLPPGSPPVTKNAAVQVTDSTKLIPQTASGSCSVRVVPPPKIQECNPASPPGQCL